ncbi:pectate lyase, partial [Streptomyces sp. 2MCAF27]
MKSAYRVTPALLVSAVTFLLTPLTIAPSSAATDSAAAGNVYYVAPNGSDSAVGTQAAPWASIAHAQSVVGAGDTVYFRGGTYSYTHGINSC